MCERLGLSSRSCRSPFGAVLVPHTPLFLSSSDGLGSTSRCLDVDEWDPSPEEERPARSACSRRGVPAGSSPTTEPLATTAEPASGPTTRPHGGRLIGRAESAAADPAPRA